MQITITCHILVNSDAAPKYGMPFAYVCVRTSILVFFWSVTPVATWRCCGNCKLTRMATSSVFLVSVKGGAMLQVVKQVSSERQVLTLCHCLDHVKTNLS